jgi:hypothetical protein
MVQILEDNGRLAQFGKAISGIPDALQNYMQRRRGEKEREEESQGLESAGYDVPASIRNPRLREALLGHQQKSKLEAEELEKDSKAAEIIGKYFGENAGEIYNVLTAGGKTKFTDYLLDDLQRTRDLDKSLGNFIRDNPQDINLGSEEEINAPEEMSGSSGHLNREDIFDEIEKPTLGLTPKEKVRMQESRYKTNLPLYQENQSKLESLRSESELIDILDKLDSSGALPATLGRINVNPVSGKILLPAFASPEAQQYVKTVQEFTSKAKDTYGARVTNFELDTFLQRLPTLANSHAGRQVIIKQMRYFNEINKAYHENLDKYIDKHGGIRNVDFDQAERIARKATDKQVKGLKTRFKSAENEGRKLVGEYAQKVKQRVPPGHILVQKDGQLGYMTPSQLEEAKKAGQNFEAV